MKRLAIAVALASAVLLSEAPSPATAQDLPLAHNEPGDLQPGPEHGVPARTSGLESLNERRASPQLPIPASELHPLTAPFWTYRPALADADLVSLDRVEAALLTLVPNLNFAAAADRFAAALRLPTYSHESDVPPDSTAFRSLHQHIENSFPRTHGRLRREVVGGLSLLYTWPGSYPELDAILLTAHMDVVPVEDEAAWTVDPLAGAVREGEIWGRGAIDNKQSVMGMLEALEQLLAAGFEPRRTIYLAFGHDEELGGARGAKAISDLLTRRGVRLAVVIDEGGVILNDFLPGSSRPVAGIGVAEKGSVNLQLLARGAGGHSAAPDRRAAIGRLARAITRLQDNRLPARMNGVTRETLRALSQERPPMQRLMMSNLWLFRPLVVAAMSRDPQANAMIRSTMAPTIVTAGEKSNVLPKTASAVINVRTMPGDTPEVILGHVRRMIADPEIEIGVVGQPRDASAVSRTESRSYQIFGEVIREINPGDDVLVVPFLVPGGTDSRHFASIADDVYRFAPMRLDKANLSGFHGVDERLPLGEYVRLIAGYYRLMIELQQM